MVGNKGVGSGGEGKEKKSLLNNIEKLIKEDKGRKVGAKEYLSCSK